jgi:hypothetical protein
LMIDERVGVDRGNYDHPRTETKSNPAPANPLVHSGIVDGKAVRSAENFQR